ncbi:class I SAM-dependent methyltransferase [Azotosporobacter soli]|uniref:class I SAM-dependent methyltransferase n=1 Tax=Azotosporobacter soli TaxID=3055040 RepID=UPI0031FE5557
MNSLAKCITCEMDENWIVWENKIEKQQQALWNHAKVQQWLLCKTCGTLFPSPITPQAVIKQAWDIARDEYQKNDFDMQRHMQKLDKSAGQIMEYFYPFVANKKAILDIGCGYGNLLHMLKNNGHNVFGIETDASTKSYHQMLGIESAIGQVEDIELDKSFDAIFLIYSIYFFTDIKSILKKLQAKLNDEGVICIAIANFLDSRNNEMPGIAHSSYPCKESLEVLLEVAGFKILSTKKYKSVIYCVAKKSMTSASAVTVVNTNKIYWLYKSKKIRYHLIGKPIVVMGKIYNAVKCMLQREQ